MKDYLAMTDNERAADLQLASAKAYEAARLLRDDVDSTTRNAATEFERRLAFQYYASKARSYYRLSVMYRDRSF